MEDIISLAEKPVIVEGGLVWKTFFSSYWLKTPVLYKNPFGAPVFSQTEILELLKRYQADLSRKVKRDITVYNKHRSSTMGILNSERINTGIEDLLPNQQADDLMAYFDQLSEKKGFEEFCIYINDAHSDEEIWKKCYGLLKYINQHMSSIPSKISCDFFIGNYEKTNFGAHRDPIDNMMFMVFGSRRMLTWSDELWKKGLGNPDSNSFIKLDYEVHREAATAYTLEPGDLLYWPSTYWHVGENDGQLSASFNLDFPTSGNDLLADEIIKKSMTDALKEVAKKLFRENGHYAGTLPRNEAGDLPGHYLQSSNQIAEKLHYSDIQTQIESNWLAKISSAGMMKPIPVNKATVANDQLLAESTERPILSRLIGETLTISSGGHIVQVRSAIEQFKEVINQVKTTTSFTIDELSTRCATPEVSKAVIAGFLQRLYAIQALELS